MDIRLKHDRQLDVEREADTIYLVLRDKEDTANTIITLTIKEAQILTKVIREVIRYR